MTSPLYRLAAATMFMLCLAPPAVGLEAQRRSVPVFEFRAGGLVRSAAEPRRSGEFPSARAIHDFDRPSREGRHRLRERAGRRLLGRAVGDVEHWHVALIRVSFETNRAPDLTSIRTGGDFDLTPDGTSIIDPTPHDKAYFDAHMQALARYYNFQSCGAVEITWQILPHGDEDSYRLSDVADYGPGRGGTWTNARLVRFVRDAIEECDRTLEAQGYPARLSDFDAIVLAHAGANLQSDVLGNSPNDIPSFFARLGDGDEIAIEGGTHLITELSVIPETAVQDGFNGGIAAVLAHEFGHQLGLPDLYDIYNNRPIVGVFDNMDSGGLLGAIIIDEDGGQHYAEGFIPGGLSAWSRYLLGWTRADTVRTFENSLALPAAGKCPARTVRVEISAEEYFLLENRAAELDGLYTGFVVDPQTGVILGMANCLNCEAGWPEQFEWGEFTNSYDLLLPTESLTPGPDGGPGLLVWHVDEYFISRRWADNEVNSRWPFGVRLVEANGVVDLGDPTSRFGLGWYDDAFYEGNATEMSDSTLPPAWSNWRVPTGVRLERVSGRDTLMTFGTGVRELRSTRMLGGGWRPAPHGVLHLPGESRALVIDESGAARLAGREEPVFSVADDGEDDPPMTPAAYMAGFDYETGQGAVILARRSGAVYTFRDGDWQACTGFWPVRVGELASHPVPLRSAAGPLIASASRQGALFLLRSDGQQLGKPGLLADDYTFTGNLVVRQDEEGLATGLFTLSSRLFDPAGVWLHSYGVDADGLEWEAGSAVFLNASEEELGGPIHLVGGEMLPQRGASQVWIVFGASGRAILCGGGEVIAERRFGAAIEQPPAVADVNGDGRLDLVCSDGERIFVVDPSGANITGWPRNVNTVFALPAGVRVSGPPAAVSENGRSWIAAATDAGILFLFDGQGALVPGWPRKTTGLSYGTLDLVAGDDEGLIACIDLLFNPDNDDYYALRPEGGRVRWRAAPFGPFDTARAWSGPFGGPGRAAFAPRSAGDGPAPRPWTDLASNLVVYPNPSDGRRVAFHFSAPETGRAQLQIFTLAGEAVLEQSLNMLGGEAEFAVSMAGRAPGIYLCRIVVTSGGRTVEARRKFAIVN